MRDGTTSLAPKSVSITPGAITTYDALFVGHGNLRVTTSPRCPRQPSERGPAGRSQGTWQPMAL